MPTPKSLATLVLAVSLAPAALAVQRPLIHEDSNYQVEVAFLITGDGLAGNVWQARAFGNDLEVRLHIPAVTFIANQTCIAQKDYAAALWERWTTYGEVSSAGASVTLMTQWGNVVASAAHTLTGMKFACAD